MLTIIKQSKDTLDKTLIKNIVESYNNYYTNNPVRASTGFDRGLESGEAIRREMR